MVNINWQFQATIPGGPALLISQPAIQFDAYDVVTASIPASAGSFPVPIQPSSTTGDVVFLVLSSSVYDTGISYTVDTVGVNHVLDGPHILVGTGAVGFLDSTKPPQTLTFNNTLTKKIDVQVVVGRKIP